MKEFSTSCLDYIAFLAIIPTTAMSFVITGALIMGGKNHDTLSFIQAVIGAAIGWIIWFIIQRLFKKYYIHWDEILKLNNGR
ncbi:MAG: hypothetical protein WCI36_00790 [bacterium]